MTLVPGSACGSCPDSCKVVCISRRLCPFTAVEKAYIELSPTYVEHPYFYYVQTSYEDLRHAQDTTLRLDVH